ncbi:MAG: CrcB family protein [Actinomycetota bacterium]
MKPLPLVALGGIAGSLLRWQFIEVSPSLSLGVFIVNQLGVLVAGFVAYRISATPSQKLFWITGFAGGFTTLSSLAFVLQGSNPISGFGYAFASLLVSLLILNLLRPKDRA